MKARNLLLPVTLVWAIGATGAAIYEYRQSPAVFSKAGQNCVTIKGEKGVNGGGDGGDATVCGSGFAISGGGGGWGR